MSKEKLSPYRVYYHVLVPMVDDIYCFGTNLPPEQHKCPNDPLVTIKAKQ